LVDEPDFFNILLMGRQGTNVDTMIFANINSSTRKITLVSVPRDLYVKGRKINSVYADYGVTEQVKWVEEILGYKIHKFALIDMFAFEDIVNLMGGVDVTLEQDLIDPTYKVCEGDVCSTLYYEAGDYHLDGTASLRVARSRYTTSDYDRAARQQLILDAMKNKAQSLGLGDANAVLKIISRAVTATETNITVDEALRYYFRYQNFDLAHGAVLSTGNVLKTVKEPVNFLTSLVVEQCLDPANPDTCSETYAIYTLRPLDDNWDAIHWFVSNQL
jgi:polyisoprenyl-teichoic acid--peptidoglycan teichoic acid transferase